MNRMSMIGVKVSVPYFAADTYIAGGPLTRALAGIDHE